MGALMDLWNAFWGGLFDFGDYLLSNLDLVAFLILAAIAVLTLEYTDSLPLARYFSLHRR